MWACGNTQDGARGRPKTRSFRTSQDTGSATLSETQGVLYAHSGSHPSKERRARFRGTGRDLRKRHLNQIRSRQAGDRPNVRPGGEFPSGRATRLERHPLRTTSLRRREIGQILIINAQAWSVPDTASAEPGPPPLHIAQVRPEWTQLRPKSRIRPDIERTWANCTRTAPTWSMPGQVWQQCLPDIRSKPPPFGRSRAHPCQLRTSTDQDPDPRDEVVQDSMPARCSNPPSCSAVKQIMCCTNSGRVACLQCAWVGSAPPQEQRSV